MGEFRAHEKDERYFDLRLGSVVRSTMVWVSEHKVSRDKYGGWCVQQCYRVSEGRGGEGRKERGVGGGEGRSRKQKK